jgi:hypothetical protein
VLTHARNRVEEAGRLFSASQSRRIALKTVASLFPLLRYRPHPQGGYASLARVLRATGTHQRRFAGQATQESPGSPPRPAMMTAKLLDD